MAAPEFIFNLGIEGECPLARTAGNSTTSSVKKVEEQEALYELCGKQVPETKKECTEKVYQELVMIHDISDFLRSSKSGYDSKCGTWAILPTAPTSEAELHEALTNLINIIIAHFHPNPEPGMSRVAVNSRDIALVHDNGTLFTKPSICIKATGPSFEVPEDAERSDGLGYTNVASVFEVRLDDEKGTRTQHCQRLAAYSRQIFIQQPNRNFARSLLLTEKQFRLVHYDRSVVYATPLLDIHKDASLFVQFVLGLTSPIERHLGLDTSVQWTIDAQSGRKASGTVELSKFDEVTKAPSTLVYELDMSEPPFLRPGIHGRGTVGWHAKDPATGEGVLVKDIWHTDSRVSECEYLQAAQGIPGIVELLASQNNCAETQQYLPPGLPNPEYHNRCKLRVAVKKYGLPLWYFRSRIQLLRALRDTLIAHHELFERGILHRDVSMFNLLLGLPNASEGCRGILIDLDMAIRTEDCKSILPADPHTGTRMYQSVAVLENWKATPIPPHDYMDDLASFFYVFSHIIYSFQKPGVLMTPRPRFLQPWCDNDLTQAVPYKSAYTLHPPEYELIAPYWGDVCMDLLEEFQQLIGKILYDKTAIRGRRRTTDEARVEAYDALSRSHNTYFEKAKSFLDNAVSELDKEGLNAEELEPYPENFVSPHLKSGVPPAPTPVKAPIDTSIKSSLCARPASPASRVSKKRLFEDNEGGTPRKRIREVPEQAPATVPLCPTPSQKGHCAPKEEVAGTLSPTTGAT